MNSDRSVLMGLTGLGIDGGIASVSRCISRAIDGEANSGRIARIDRVLLLDDPDTAPPPPVHGRQLLSRGSQARMVWQLWRCFRRSHHDIVLFDHFGLARAAVLPLPGYPPPRYAIFCHGIEMGPIGRTGSRRKVLDNAWRLLANSEFTADSIRERFPEVASRVRSVPLCIDPARTERWDALEARPLRRPAVLIVARMNSEERGKGHDTLLDAWPDVVAAVPEAELWIAGGGNDRQHYEAIAATRADGRGIRFLGRVSDDELARLYRSASIFAMPSRQEGFGLVYAEAMWQGLPCIASEADAAREVIGGDEYGRLVPYGAPDLLATALVALLADPKQCRRLGDNSERSARERFGYGRFRDDLLRALDLD